MNKLCENGDQGGIIVNPPVSIFKKKYLVALIAASMPAMAMAQTTPSAGWNNKGEDVVTDSENLTGSIYFGGGSTLRVEGGLIQDLDRKSTRLNSSRVASSYAVVCLNEE